MEPFGGSSFKRLVSRVIGRMDGREQYEIDPGALQLLMRPRAINLEDDHFDEPSLNPKWTLLGTTPTNLNFSSLPGWVFLLGNIAQPVPPSDWSVETEVLLPNQTSAGYHQGGFILLSSGTLSAGTQHTFVYGFDNSVANNIFQINKLVNGGYNSTVSQLTALPHMSDHVFLKLIKSGTTFYIEWSRTGKRWSRWTSITTTTMGYTPTHVGIRGDVGSAYLNYFIRR